MLRDYRTTEYASKTGFSFHVISDEEAGFAWGKTQNGIGARRVDPVTYHTLYEEFVIHGVTDFKERPEDANAFYDRYDYGQLAEENHLTAGQIAEDIINTL